MSVTREYNLTRCLPFLGDAGSRITFVTPVWRREKARDGEDIRDELHVVEVPPPGPLPSQRTQPPHAVSVRQLPFDPLTLPFLRLGIEAGDHAPGAEVLASTLRRNAVL